MPVGPKSTAYFAATKVMAKVLGLVSDPIGKFYKAQNMAHFAKISKASPIQKSITGVMISSDHQICSEVLKSANWLARPFAERLYLATSSYEPETIHPFLDSVIAMDGPEHRRIKKIMQSVFNGQMSAAWKDSARQILNKLLAEIDFEKEIDFVSAIASIFPLQVICQVIGVPAEHSKQCLAWGSTLAGIGLDLPTSNAELVELEQAALGLTNLIAELVIQRRLDPSTDLISVLANAEIDGDTLSDKEIIATAAFTLIAGFETTANLLSVGMMHLLEDPSQLDLLRSNRDLLANFIEESLRVSSPIQFVVRTSDSRLALGDIEVPAEKTIILNLAGANRDPKVFSNPDRFEIQRENARKNVSFGFGAHHCIGALLARVEAEVLFDELLNRFPKTENWIKTGEHRYRTGKLIRPLETLPMKFL